MANRNPSTSKCGYLNHRTLTPFLKHVGFLIRFQIHMVSIKMIVFKDTATCNLISTPWWWRQKEPLKSQLISIRLHRAISQKTAICVSVCCGIYHLANVKVEVPFFPSSRLKVKIMMVANTGNLQNMVFKPLRAPVHLMTFIREKQKIHT